MGGRTGFHHDQGDAAVDEEALELCSRQALGVDGAPLAVGDAELEHGLAEVDSDDGAFFVQDSLGGARLTVAHGWTPEVGPRLDITSPHGASDARRSAGESIPSLTFAFSIGLDRGRRTDDFRPRIIGSALRAGTLLRADRNGIGTPSTRHRNGIETTFDDSRPEVIAFVRNVGPKNGGKGHRHKCNSNLPSRPDTASARHGRFSWRSHVFATRTDRHFSGRMLRWSVEQLPMEGTSAERCE